MGPQIPRSRFGRPASGPSNAEIARSVFRADVGHVQFPEATELVEDIRAEYDPGNFVRTSQAVKVTPNQGIRYSHSPRSPTFPPPPGLWYKFWRFVYLASLISATILFLLSLKEAPKGITFTDKRVTDSHGVGESGSAHSWVSKFFENTGTRGSSEPEATTVVVVKTPEPEATIPARKRWFGLGNEETSKAQPTRVHTPLVETVQTSLATPAAGVKEITRNVIKHLDVREWDLNVKRHLLGQTKPTREVKTNTATWNLNVKQFLASRAAAAKEQVTTAQETLSTDRPTFKPADLAKLKSESYTTKSSSTATETDPNHLYSPGSKNDLFPRLINVALSLYEPILDHSPLIDLAAHLRIAREVFHRAEQTLWARNTTLSHLNSAHKSAFKKAEAALSDYRFLGRIHADPVFSANPRKILREIDAFQHAVARLQSPRKDRKAREALLEHYKWQLFHNYYQRAELWVEKLVGAEKAVSLLRAHVESAAPLVRANLDTEARFRRGKDLSNWLVGAQARETAQRALVAEMGVLCRAAEVSLRTARERVEAVLEGKKGDEARFGGKEGGELGGVGDVGVQRDLVVLVGQETERRFAVADRALREIGSNKGRDVRDHPALA